MRQGQIMKKFILLFVIALGVAVNTAYAEISFTPVTPEYPGEGPQAAMTVDEENVAVVQPALVYESGEDVIVVIFDTDNNYFVVEKQFTIPGVLKNGLQIEKLRSGSADTEMVSFSVFKNFFVKNDKWCIVLGYEDALSEGFTGKNRVQVMDEDGNLLGYLPDSDSRPKIFLDGFMYGTPYLWTDTEWNKFRIYSFIDQSGIESTKVNSVTSAYPNPLPAGATFTVNFEQPADDATFFSVLDMKGRQVYCRRVNPGDNSFRLSGTRFGHGHYIYTVVYKDGNSVTGRLMAE